MKIGFITADRAEQSNHRQKKRILHKYPDLLIMEIRPYDDDLFVNPIPRVIVKLCEDNHADTAIMDSVHRITPDPKEFIEACTIITNNEISIEFIDQPWMNSSVWYGEDTPDSIVRIHENVTRITYDWIEATRQHYSKARQKGGKTTEERGHKYGPRKGSTFKLTPDKEEKMMQILVTSPTFVETDKTEVQIEKELGIPHATYSRYKGKLVEMYPEKVRKK